MRHDTMKGESGVSAPSAEHQTTQAVTNTASDSFRDNEKGQPLLAEMQMRAPPTRVGKEADVMNTEETQDNLPELLEKFGFVFGKDGTRDVQIDLAKFQVWLDDTDIPEEQRAEVVQATWTFVVSFVALGYGVSPLEQACGQLSEIEDQSGNPESAMLECGPTTLSDRFNKQAAE